MAEHTVKSFEEALAGLRKTISDMGELVKREFEVSVEAVVRRDPGLAVEALDRDAQVDELEREAGEAALRLLALRQPVGIDLREAVAAIKISSDLERIGDLSKNLAKHAHVLSHSQYASSLGRIGRIGRIVDHQIGDALRAYATRDSALALQVWRYDAEIDDWFHSLFRELVSYMLEDARTISVCTHVLFVGKNVERIGDHCANVAATIYYLVEGVPLTERRPKGEDAAYATVEPKPASAGE